LKLGDAVQQPFPPQCPAPKLHPAHQQTPTSDAAHRSRPPTDPYLLRRYPRDPAIGSTQAAVFQSERVRADRRSLAWWVFPSGIC
jgi:hypothetical protein